MNVLYDPKRSAYHGSTANPHICFKSKLSAVFKTTNMQSAGCPLYCADLYNDPYIEIEHNIMNTRLAF